MDEPRPHTLWRHAKTGETYWVYGVAACSTNGDRDGIERSVFYRNIERPELYYRELGEFMDGRFVRLSPPPDPAPARPAGR